MEFGWDDVCHGRAPPLRSPEAFGTNNVMNLTRKLVISRDAGHRQTSTSESDCGPGVLCIVRYCLLRIGMRQSSKVSKTVNLGTRPSARSSPSAPAATADDCRSWLIENK